MSILVLLAAREEEEGQKYPGRCQLYNSYPGKAEKSSVSVNNGLDTLTNFSFWVLTAAKTFTSCYFAYWDAGLSDYLSQRSIASSILQHNLHGQVFGEFNDLN